jgi:hypothetical protein
MQDSHRSGKKISFKVMKISWHLQLGQKIFNFQQKSAKLTQVWYLLENILHILTSHLF